MSRRLAAIFPAVALLSAALTCTTPAFAHDPDSLEAAARMKEGEAAQLDLQSITRYGETQGRFEVFVAWAADTNQPMPQNYTPRRVRYFANCQEGTVTLAAVGLMDDTGQVQKTIVAPPGSIDPVKPEKGTALAKWLQRVCMF